MTELKYTSLIKIIIQEENFEWHLEAFASELFIYSTNTLMTCCKAVSRMSKVDYRNKVLPISQLNCV